VTDRSFLLKERPVSSRFLARRSESDSWFPADRVRWDPLIPENLFKPREQILRQECIARNCQNEFPTTRVVGMRISASPQAFVISFLLDACRFPRFF